MSDDREDEAFLSRWSRRKIEARKLQEKPAEPAPVPASAASANTAAAQSGVPAPVVLPPLESLKGLASEYRDFMRPGVDENMKRSALKKLFSDPHFENFERFEAYCEDYTKGEPIPLAMLKTLEHAKGLLFDEEKKEEKQEEESLVAGSSSKQGAVLQEPAKAPQAQALAKPESPAAQPKLDPKA